VMVLVSSSDCKTEDVDKVDCDLVETNGRGAVELGDFRDGGDEQGASGWVVPGTPRTVVDGPPAPRDDDAPPPPRRTDCSEGELPLRTNDEHDPDVCISCVTVTVTLRFYAYNFL